MNLKGYSFSAVEAAVKKPGRLDLALIVSDTPAKVAAVFTTNRVKAAPVLLCQEHVKDGSCRAIIVNSGNANACTGAQGLEDARTMARTVADGLSIREDAVLVSSTGVIGQPLPMERIVPSIPKAIEALDGEKLGDVARAIMTTDTFPKMEVRRGSASGTSYTIAGIAKGAGMIMPNMATMLAYIVTDAAVEQGLLEKVFKDGVDSSFNMISVDGDTSTNDTAIIMANGAAGNTPVSEGTPDAAEFATLTKDVLLSLAKQIVRDGEGATKFVEITVAGAESTVDAKTAAMAVANSLLVKTAFFGQDANWGRILAAVGYSGIPMQQECVAISFNDVMMVQNGLFVGGDAEARGSEVLRLPEFTITIDLKMGAGQATVYTSDLSYDYVKINADYRT